MGHFLADFNVLATFNQLWPVVGAAWLWFRDGFCSGFGLARGELVPPTLFIVAAFCVLWHSGFLTDDNERGLPAGCGFVLVVIFFGQLPRSRGS